MDRIAELEIEIKKRRLYYDIFNLWLDMKQQGKSFIPYLKDNGYNHVALYGMNEIGERMYYELRDSEVVLEYVIDRNPYILGDFNVYLPDQSLPEVDLVIVVAEYYFYDIMNTLKKKMNCRIISVSQLFAEAFHRVF